MTPPPTPSAIYSAIYPASYAKETMGAILNIAKSPVSQHDAPLMVQFIPTLVAMAKKSRPTHTDGEKWVEHYRNENDRLKKENASLASEIRACRKELRNSDERARKAEALATMFSDDALRAASSIPTCGKTISKPLGSSTEGPKAECHCSDEIPTISMETPPLNGPADPVTKGSPNQGTVSPQPHGSGRFFNGEELVVTY